MQFTLGVIGIWHGAGFIQQTDMLQFRVAELAAAAVPLLKADLDVAEALSVTGHVDCDVTKAPGSVHVAQAQTSLDNQIAFSD